MGCQKKSVVYEMECRHAAVQRGGLLGTGRMGGMGVRRWGEREIIYRSLPCHHQNDLCIKVGSDESHFNVS